MGAKHKEQIERIQKESLCHRGIKIIALDQNSDSPFDILEGINFLKSGGFVSITGDVITSYSIHYTKLYDDGK